MKRTFVVALLFLFAAAAFAVEGTYVPSGSYGFFFGTPAQAADPNFTIYFTTCKGPPRTLTSGGTIFTWNPDDEIYRDPSGDTWSFDGVGHGTFTDWPPFPQYGPGVPTNGLLFR